MWADTKGRPYRGRRLQIVISTSQRRRSNPRYISLFALIAQPYSFSLTLSQPRLGLQSTFDFGLAASNGSTITIKRCCECLRFELCLRSTNRICLTESLDEILKKLWNPK